MTFDTIVAATDLEGASTPGLEAAADIARRYGGRLVLVAVASGSDVHVELASHDVHDARGELERDMKARLADTAASVGSGIEVETRLRFGEPVTELLAAAREVGAGAIVITVKNRSRLGKMVMGSKAQEIILRSDLPVLCVPRR